MSHADRGTGRRSSRKMAVTKNCSEMLTRFEPAALARLEAQGVTVLEGVHRFGNTARQAAMIEGPDAIAIELVER